MLEYFRQVELTGEPLIVTPRRIPRAAAGRGVAGHPQTDLVDPDSSHRYRDLAAAAELDWQHHDPASCKCPSVTHRLLRRRKKQRRRECHEIEE